MSRGKNGTEDPWYPTGGRKKASVEAYVGPSFCSGPVPLLSGIRDVVSFLVCCGRNGEELVSNVAFCVWPTLSHKFRVPPRIPSLSS